MPKTKLFVSFDFDNDRTLRDFVIGQAKLPDSPFDVTDVSLHEAAPEKEWEAKARAAIRRADKFLVMLGPKTNKAPGVLKEVLIATEEQTPRYQVIGYKNGDSSWSVPGAGRTYNWDWNNIKTILA